ncbi:hypothetical protein [Flavobacterium sharifuzzamanii]|uniref:hypothetical protein n=1 Tax=Flavobacterium sharifuzzamanii TaxID=2211133 RepID=UPI0013002A75|nr:hypothetical protein [Flavobacterium sharifuzzamanii]KAF2082059.1 hypothetical protein DMA14_06205 [Flavobacterium sharifuzzamanii]
MKIDTPETVSKLLRVIYRKIKSLEKSVNGESSSKAKRMVCCSSLKKNELAFILYILMDEGILFFDRTNPVKNRSLLQTFFEKNFSYRGEEGLQMPVRSISREFSEAKGYTYQEKQCRLLDSIINRLQRRKERIKLKSQ